MNRLIQALEAKTIQCISSDLFNDYEIFYDVRFTGYLQLSNRFFIEMTNEGFFKFFKVEEDLGEIPYTLEQQLLKWLHEWRNERLTPDEKDEIRFDRICEKVDFQDSRLCV